MSRYHELKKLGFSFDHTATERGYVSRKVECVVKPYVTRIMLYYNYRNKVNIV